MTQDEIIEIVMQIGGCDRPEDDSPALKIFVAFAKLVAEKEREACAKICDEFFKGNKYQNYSDTIAICIRARDYQKGKTD